MGRGKTKRYSINPKIYKMKMEKEIREIIKNAKFMFVSKESSREDLLEIIDAQLGWWEELEELLNSQNKT